MGIIPKQNEKKEQVLCREIDKSKLSLGNAVGETDLWLERLEQGLPVASEALITLA